MLKRYSFFVIVNVKTSEFQVFATAMRDYRLRLSAMKSSFKRWANQTDNDNVDTDNVNDNDNVCETGQCMCKDILEHPYREYYKFFMSGWEYAYILDKGMYCEETANEHVNFLTQTLQQQSSNF